jgi:hypothetical protein
LNEAFAGTAAIAAIGGIVGFSLDYYQKSC